MRQLIVALLLMSSIPVYPAGLFIASVNMAHVYCSGVGVCGAFGTAPHDLLDGNNWTIHYKIKRDFANPTAGNRSWHFASATLNSTPNDYLCAQPMLVWDATTNSNMLLRVYVGIMGGGLGITQVLSSSFDFDTDSNWHDITLTHTSGHQWTLYVDGSQDATTNTSVTTSANCDVFIGGVSANNACGFNPSGCYIVDVATWTVALSANDAKAMATGTRPNQVSHNPDYWIPFDGGYQVPASIGGIHDGSGNGHDAGPGTTPHYDYPDIPLKATNSTVGPESGEATH